MVVDCGGWTHARTHGSTSHHHAGMHVALAGSRVPDRHCPVRAQDNTRVCSVRVTYASDLAHPALRVLQRQVPNLHRDIAVVSAGLHYGINANEQYTADLRYFTEYAVEQRDALPLLIWKDVPPQHFEYDRGYYWCARHGRLAAGACVSLCCDGPSMAHITATSCPDASLPGSGVMRALESSAPHDQRSRGRRACSACACMQVGGRLQEGRAGEREARALPGADGGGAGQRRDQGGRAGTTPSRRPSSGRPASPSSTCTTRRCRCGSSTSGTRTARITATLDPTRSGPSCWLTCCGR